MKFHHFKADLQEEDAEQVFTYAVKSGARENDRNPWEEARQQATKQAEELRHLANVIQRVGIPLMLSEVNFAISTWQHDDDDQRRIALKATRMLNAIASDFYPGVDRTKPQANPNSQMWGLSIDAGIKLKHQLFNQATCEMVPVVDDEGNPVLEEVEVREEVEVVTTTKKQPKMEKQCIQLFEVAS